MIDQPTLRNAVNGPRGATGALARESQSPVDMATTMLNPFQARHFDQAPTGESAWVLPTRVGFRFGLLFALLVVLPFPFGMLPGTQFIADQYAAFADPPDVQVR